MKPIKNADNSPAWLSILEHGLNGSREMVVITGPSRRVIWVNATFLRDTGWTETDCKGKYLRELLQGPPEAASALEKLMALVERQAPVTDFDLIASGPFGGPLPLCLNVEALPADNGIPLAYVCWLRLLKQPVVTPAAAQPEVKPAQRSARPQTTPVTPAMLSRDLAEPLRSAARLTHTLKEGLAAASLNVCENELEQLTLSVARMRETVNGFLGLSAGGEPLPRTRIDVGELVRELVDTLMSGTGLRTIAWTIDPELPQIEADPSLVREVWNKLLANALTRSAYQDVSSIEVGWRPQPRGWEFFVHDNGCSFDASQAGQLFEVLVRPGSRERSASAGAGRSLALVRRIVEIHGGRVWSHSELGQGASFHFFLPSRTESPVPEPVDKAAPANQV